MRIGLYYILLAALPSIAFAQESEKIQLQESDTTCNLKNHFHIGIGLSTNYWLYNKTTEEYHPWVRDTLTGMNIVSDSTVVSTYKMDDENRMNPLIVGINVHLLYSFNRFNIGTEVNFQTGHFNRVKFRGGGLDNSRRLLDFSKVLIVIGHNIATGNCYSFGYAIKAGKKWCTSDCKGYNFKNPYTLAMEINYFTGRIKPAARWSLFLKSGAEYSYDIFTEDRVSSTMGGLGLMAYFNQENVFINLLTAGFQF